MEECWISRYHVEKIKDMNEEDIDQCKGIDCNFCGKFNEEHEPRKFDSR